MYKSVVLQFVTEDDPISRIIRRFSHGEVSHVDGVLSDGRLLGSRYEGGVQIRPPDYAPFSTVVRVEIETPHADEIYALALSQVDRPYDSKAIIAFAFGRDWRDNEAWFCSELWAWALEQGSAWQHRIAQQVSRITPVDLLMLASSIGITTEIRGDAVAAE